MYIVIASVHGYPVSACYEGADFWEMFADLLDRFFPEELEFHTVKIWEVKTNDK